MPVIKKVKDITDADTEGNRIYCLMNAYEAGQENMSWLRWRKSHPHINNVKDSELTNEYKKKAKEKYSIE